MKPSFQSRKDFPPVRKYFYYIVLVGIEFLYLMGILQGNTNTILGASFWLSFGLMFYFCRSDSKLHRPMGTDNTKEKLLIAAAILLTIICCISPMDLSPTWNGEDPDHRNQYELLAESFLDGKLYIEYGDEAELLTLTNPYDPAERRESGVSYHWDHAYYNGRYYMYFGVVPVILLFLPYRILTGTALTTFRATQFFVAWIIIGFFCLFRLLQRNYFRKMSIGMYLLLSASFSVISVWYSIARPALYCTAITSGICMMLWSIFFFCKGVWDCEDLKKQLFYALLGSLFGALTFGCRPPIGFANILVIPLLITFLKQHRMNPKLFRNLCLAVSPYLVVAIALMCYNYARFENPFEFGQSYQLTSSDQRELFQSVTLVRVVNDLLRNIFDYTTLKEEFPYVTHSGLLFNFPIFLCLYSGLLPSVREKLKEKGLGVFTIFLLIAIVIITVMDAIGAPYLMERYRMDIYFIASILGFIMLGTWQETLDTSRHCRFSVVTMHVSVLMIFLSVFHYFRELDADAYNFMELLEPVICFWKNW